MERNSSEYQNLVWGWAHGFKNDEFRSDSLNRVKEILSDFPELTSAQIVEEIRGNEEYLCDYALGYWDIHRIEGFVAEENHEFFADVMAEIERAILATRGNP